MHVPALRPTIGRRRAAGLLPDERDPRPVPQSGASPNARARVRYTAVAAWSGLATDAAGFVNGGGHADEPGLGPPLMDGDHARLDQLEAREVADDLLVLARGM